MSETKTTWYILPRFGHTAQVLGREIGEDDLCPQKLCADKRKHDLYRCTWAFVDKALKSAGEHQLMFSIWKQEGQRPPERFDPKRIFSGRAPKEIRQTREQLRRIAVKAAQG